MNDVVTFFWDFGGHPTRHVLGSAHKRPLGRLPSARSRHIEKMAQNFNIFQPIPKIWKPGHIYIYIYHLSSREMNGHDTWSMHRSVTTLNSDFVILICMKRILRNTLNTQPMVHGIHRNLQKSVPGVSTGNRRDDPAPPFFHRMRIIF